MRCIAPALHGIDGVIECVSDGVWSDGFDDKGVVEVVSMGRIARKHNQLDVYQSAMSTAMAIFDVSRGFPVEERYSLTDQIRRSSRFVSANFAEAWHKRRYPAAFISKLGDAEAEAAETQVWIEFAVKCRYLERAVARDLYGQCDRIIKTIVGMITHADTGPS